MNYDYDKRIKLIAYVYPLIVLLVSISEYPHIAIEDRFIYFGGKAVFAILVTFFGVLFLKKKWEVLILFIFLLGYFYGSFSQIYRPLYFINFIQTTCFFPLLFPIKQKNYFIGLVIGLVSYLVAFIYSFESYQALMSQVQKSDIIVAVIITAILGLILNATLTKGRLFYEESVEKFSIIGEVSTAISHNVKGMMSSPLFDLEILKNESNEKGDQKLTNSLKSIYEKFERSESILKELNYIAHVAYEKKEYVQLSKVIQKCEALLALSRKGIKVHLVNDYNYYCDKTQLESIFITLMLNSQNSFNSSKKQSPVIEIKEKAGELIFSDNGGGFTKDVLKGLQDGRYTPANRESGLGLYMVGNLVKRMGGTVSYSNSEQGALIKLKLPKSKLG